MSDGSGYALRLSGSKTAVICLAIMVLSYTLARHEGIPSILILLAVVVFIYSYFTKKTVPGRYLYAVGGNEKAAKLSGINTNKVLFFAYVNMAFLSALAALMCVARFNSAAPTAGASYEMDAIGSCYIGGASAYGGIGSVAGVVIGAIFMGVVNYPHLKVKLFEERASCFNDYCTLFLNERMRLAQSPRGLTSRSSYGTKKVYCQLCKSRR